MLLNKYVSDLTKAWCKPFDLREGSFQTNCSICFMALFHLPVPQNRRGKSPSVWSFSCLLCCCLERTVVTHLLELIFPYGHSQNHHASQCVLTPWPRVCVHICAVRNNQIPLLEMFWIVSICWLHIIRSNAFVFCETQYFALALDTFCMLLCIEVHKVWRLRRWELTLQIWFDKWEFLSESMQSGAVIHFVSSSRQNCHMR